MSEYTSETDEQGNTVIRDADGNICEIQTADGMRVYAGEPQPACTCEWEDDGDAENGPHLTITRLDPECPNPEHRLAARVTDWGPVTVTDGPMPSLRRLMARGMSRTEAEAELEMLNREAEENQRAIDAGEPYRTYAPEPEPEK
jgi:hypothetical protein